MSQKLTTQRSDLLNLDWYEGLHLPILTEHGNGSHEGTFDSIASTAWAAAIRVSHDELCKYACSLFNKLCNSCGWSFWTSPICLAAARRVTPDDPDSSKINKRSNLKANCLFFFLFLIFIPLWYLKLNSIYNFQFIPRSHCVECMLQGVNYCRAECISFDACRLKEIKVETG